VVRLLPVFAGALGLWAVARLARAARGVPSALGAGTAQMRTVADRSPHAVDARFANTEPGAVAAPANLAVILGRVLARGRAGRPSGPVPLVPGAPDGPAVPLAVTWFGHSSVLLEIDGHRVLADPMWSERASPSRRIGPRRLHPTPTSLDRLPASDAVLISHDHYDHLDEATVSALVRLSAASFVVPLGIGGHLRRWGVPGDRIVELDWGEETRVGDLTLTCVECRHFSGRRPARNTTQWSAWAVTGPAHRAYPCRSGPTPTCGPTST
jgi:beta-lactamase family protein